MTMNYMYKVVLLVVQLSIKDILKEEVLCKLRNILYIDYKYNFCLQCPFTVNK